MKLIFICNNYRVFMMRLRNILCNKRLPCVKYKTFALRQIQDYVDTIYELCYNSPINRW